VQWAASEMIKLCPAIIDEDALFRELFVIIGIGLILGAVCVFLAGMGMQGT
jgi:hypothetical protein